jgi:hypothetical protein
MVTVVRGCGSYRQLAHRSIGHQLDQVGGNGRQNLDAILHPTPGLNKDPRRHSFFQQAAQHPCCLFMHFESLGQQIRRRLVVGSGHDREHLARRAGRGFLR